MNDDTNIALAKQYLLSYNTELDRATMRALLCEIRRTAAFDDHTR